MARSKRPLYPGILTSKERVDRDSLAQPEAVQYLFVEFNFTALNIAQEIGTIPAKSIIISPIVIRVIEPFVDGVGTEIRLQLETEGDVGFALLNVPGVLEFIPNTSDYFLQVLAEKKTLSYVIHNPSTNNPTSGSGWCLLSYVNTLRI